MITFYTQVLSLSQVTIGQISIGHIVNLASNDVQRFDLVWCVCVCVCVCGVFSMRPHLIIKYLVPVLLDLLIYLPCQFLESTLQRFQYNSIQNLTGYNRWD